MPEFKKLFSSEDTFEIQERFNDKSTVLLQVKDKFGAVVWSVDKSSSVARGSDTWSATSFTLADGNPATDRVWIASQTFNPTVGAMRAVMRLTHSMRGLSLTGVGSSGLSVLMQDQGTVVNKTITGAVNNGSGLIRVTAVGHTFLPGDRIGISGVGGVTNANNVWAVTIIDANTFDLQASTFSGTYTSGGQATNRPYGIGVHVQVSPSLDRGFAGGGTIPTGANGDDLNGFVAENTSGVSGHKATDAFYVAGNVTGASWDHAFACDANLNQAALQFTADLTGAGVNASMVDLGSATASGGGSAIRLPNNIPVTARNGANSADVTLFRCTSTNLLQFESGINLVDNVVVQFGTGVGVNLGYNATEKLGFWGATPIVRPSSTGTATGFTAGAGTAVNDQSTFTGNVGSTAYRLSDIVKHLKNLGLISP